MGIKDIYISFKYRGLDIGITVQGFEVGDSQEVYIEDFEISLDYCASKDKPYPSDSAASMINAMLSDGRRLQDKIFELIRTEDMEEIDDACRKAWSEYWWDVKSDCGDYLLDFGDDMI